MSADQSTTQPQPKPSYARTHMIPCSLWPKAPQAKPYTCQLNHAVKRAAAHYGSCLPLSSITHITPNSPNTCGPSCQPVTSFNLTTQMHRHSGSSRRIHLPHPLIPTPLSVVSGGTQTQNFRLAVAHAITPRGTSTAVVCSAADWLMLRRDRIERYICNTGINSCAADTQL
jgi:hypothetical protein